MEKQKNRFKEPHDNKQLFEKATQVLQDLSKGKISPQEANAISKEIGKKIRENREALKKIKKRI